MSHLLVPVQIRAGVPLKAITPVKDSSELIEGRG